jgi:glycosyltransferase involved in cell wall biosynthesis
LLDEQYPIYCNDVDLARRLSAAGHVLWTTPEAVVEHELGASTRLLASARTRQYVASLVRYVTATEPRSRSVPFRICALLEGLARRALRRPGSLPLTQLAAAVRGDPGPLPQGASWVVYLSAIPWSYYRHRQQELAGQLARSRRVLFVEPPGLLPRLGLRVEQLDASLWRAAPPTVLPFGRFLPPANAVNRRLAARALRRWLDQRPGGRLLWIDEDLAAPVAGRLDETAVVYDAADLDWTFTRAWNRPHLRRALATATRKANLLLTSSRPLTGLLRRDGRDVVELPNACDPEHFRPDGEEAAALARLPRPRVGYVGLVDERAFDARLVAGVARLRPQWSLVLVGPSTEAARRSLAGLANVHLLGPADYADVPALLRGIDVGVIPYRTTERIAYRQPKKLYEYLAAGKPVVSTPLPALDGIDAPHAAAATPEEFVTAVEAALGEKDSTAPARRRSVAAANSWDARGRQLHAVLRALEERTA